MKRLEELSFKLAAALLMRDGQLSVNDIEALPFVEDEALATAIALSLINRFDLDWDDEMIRLTDRALAPKKNPTQTLPIISLKNKLGRSSQLNCVTVN